MNIIDGSVFFEETSNSLIKGEVKITISEKEKKLLICFLNNPDSEIEKEDLINYIWDERSLTIIDANLTQLIHKLRRSLAAVGLPDCIQTIPRKGYIYISPPQPQPSEPTLPSENHKNRSNSIPDIHKKGARIAWMVIIITVIALVISASIAVSNKVYLAKKSAGPVMSEITPDLKNIESGLTSKQSDIEMLKIRKKDQKYLIEVRTKDGKYYYDMQNNLIVKEQK